MVDWADGSYFDGLLLPCTAKVSCFEERGRGG